MKVIELTYEVKPKPFPEGPLQMSEEEGKALARKVSQRIEDKLLQHFGGQCPVYERKLGFPCWPWADYIRWGK